MPRVTRWKSTACGVMLRAVTITTCTRAELLARVQGVNTFRHKRLIVKQWRREHDTL